MMNLRIKLERAGCADGVYQVSAKGALFVELRWADESGPLTGWMPFAYLPIDPYGTGSFRFSGERAVPSEATHIRLRAVTPQPEVREMSVELPKAALAEEAAPSDGVSFDRPPVRLRRAHGGLS